MPNFVTDGAIGIDLDSVVSADFATGKYGIRCGLGETHEGNNASEWIYVLATSAVTLGSMVVIETNNTISALASPNLVSANRRIGFAQTAFATSQYGFVATRGNALLIRLVGGAAGGGGQPLYSTDTAGALSTATNTASAFPIWNVYLKSSVSVAGTSVTVATAALSWPMRGASFQR